MVVLALMCSHKRAVMDKDAGSEELKMTLLPVFDRGWTKKQAVKHNTYFSVCSAI